MQELRDSDSEELENYTSPPFSHPVRAPPSPPPPEFSELMSEHFVDFPPSGGMRNYVHGGKGPFRTSN